MSSKLDLKETVYESVIVISLAGMLDGHTAPILDSHLERMAATKHFQVVFELRNLTYISSAGVGLLINYFQQAESEVKQGRIGKIAIASPSDVVSEVFSLLGLEALIECFPTREEAVAAVR